MTCYVDLAVDITKLPNYAKIKQTADLANATLRGDINFGYGRKELVLGKLVDLTLCFDLINLEEINTLKTLNILMLKIKKQKTYIFTQYTEN